MGGEGCCTLTIENELNPLTSEFSKMGDGVQRQATVELYG